MKIQIKRRGDLNIRRGLKNVLDLNNLVFNFLWIFSLSIENKI